MQQGAARFTVDSNPQRADAGELFLLEPEAVHTGMAAVPEGWRYQVLYVEPEVLSDWAEHEAGRRAPPNGWCSGIQGCAGPCFTPTPRWPPRSEDSRSRRRSSARWQD